LTVGISNDLPRIHGSSVDSANRFAKRRSNRRLRLTAAMRQSFQESSRQTREASAISPVFSKVLLGYAKTAGLNF
jgi:hypothetical protein